MNGPKITMIPADIKNPPSQKRKLKVAAYCRVSTEHEEQQSSYAAQISYYNKYIQGHEDWELAGIFADEGISATNTLKRSQFNEMLKFCNEGKIDMVITKSISRFARNTVDCLVYIRQLKALGIPVLFEKENINTMDANGEFIITLLGSLAQEESRNISTNIKWGIEKRFQAGKVRVPRLYGYEKDTNGELIIHPDTAKNVKLIFKLFLEGYSFGRIARYLQEKQITSPTGNLNWDTSTLSKIITNEKYTGDAILQKYYNPDFLTHKSKVNNGEVRKYFVEGSHPPIISKAVFHQAQEEYAKRKTIRKSASSAKSGKGKYSAKYVLSNKAVCAYCGKLFRRVTWYQNGGKKAVWRCLNRIEHGKRICTLSQTVEESCLQRAVMQALCSLAEPDINAIIAQLTDNIASALTGNSLDKSLQWQKTERQITLLKQELFQTITENPAKEPPLSQDSYYQEIVDKIRFLAAEKKNFTQIKSQTPLKEKQLALESFLYQAAANFPYDESTVAAMVDKVFICSKNSFNVKLKSGETVIKIALDNE